MQRSHRDPSLPVPPTSECVERAVLTVAVMVLAPQTKRLLLVQDLDDTFALPGGELLPTETFWGAAYREVYQKTGLELMGYGYPVDVRGEPKRDPRGRYVSWVHAYLLTWEASVFPNDPSIQSVGWYPWDHLPSPMALDHQDIIESVLRGVPVVRQLSDWFPRQFPRQED